MPITNWLCSGCGGREVGLDHFATTPCGEKIVHPDYAAAVLASQNKTRAGIHVSTLLGCPRKTAIESSEPYSVDPLSLNAMETGTAWHSHMEKNSSEPKMTEVDLSGFIAGIKVVGRCDRMRNKVLEDWKHGNDFGKKYAKEGAKEAHQAQVSIYAELWEQTWGWRPTLGRIWYHFSTGDKDAMIAQEFTIWQMSRVLEFRPGGGAYTVLDLLGQTASPVAWQHLELAGESIMYGQKSLCDYCPVAGICKTQATGAPF